MKLENCKINNKYILLEDMPRYAYKKGEVIKCVGMIKDFDDPCFNPTIKGDVIIVPNDNGPAAYRPIPCNIIEEFIPCYEKRFNKKELLQRYNEPDYPADFVDKCHQAVETDCEAKKIFYATQECKISVPEPYKYGTVDGLQVERKCTCPIDMVMNVGCKCGGK